MLRSSGLISKIILFLVLSTALPATPVHAGLWDGVYNYFLQKQADRFEGSALYFQNHTLQDFKALISDANFKEALRDKRIYFNGEFWMIRMLEKFEEENLQVVRALRRNQYPTSYLQETLAQQFLLTEKTILKKSTIYGFSMNAAKQIFIFDSSDWDPEDYTLHHSSFTAGGDLAAPGTIGTDEEGLIDRMIDASGHYNPPVILTAQAIPEFQKLGFKFSEKFVLIPVHNEALPVPNLLFDQFALH